MGLHELLVDLRFKLIKMFDVMAIIAVLIVDDHKAFKILATDSIENLGQSMDGTVHQSQPLEA